MGIATMSKLDRSNAAEIYTVGFVPSYSLRQGTKFSGSISLPSHGIFGKRPLLKVLRNTPFFT